MIRIEMDDREVREALGEIGEYLVASTKLRFRAGTAPDGTPWALNSPVTVVLRYLARFGGSFRRRGKGLKWRSRLGAPLARTASLANRRSCSRFALSVPTDSRLFAVS